MIRRHKKIGQALLKISIRFIFFFFDGKRFPMVHFPELFMKYLYSWLPQKERRKA